MNEQQKKAVEKIVEAVAKQHFEGVQEMQIVLYRAMLKCMEEVINNPEKYGLKPIEE